MPINRNILYLIIGALIVAVSVLGYNLHQAKKAPDGLQISVGPNGVKDLGQVRRVVADHARRYAIPGWAAVCGENLSTRVMVMKPTQDGA